MLGMVTSVTSVMAVTLSVLKSLARPQLALVVLLVGLTVPAKAYWAMALALMPALASAA